MHSRAKTNSDNHLICVMYDRLSLEDKLSDDLECAADAEVAAAVLPVRRRAASDPGRAAASSSLPS